MRRLSWRRFNFFSMDRPKQQEKLHHDSFSVYWVMVRKEFTDYMMSWRIIILLAIIALTCLGSLYTAVTSIQEAVSQSEEAQTVAKDSFLFLKLLTVSDGTLPPFTTFITFLGPLLGIALGFDAVNSERNKGTLSRLVSQPIPRDSILNAKFMGALLLNVVLFFTLGLLVTGLGILIIGIPPTFEEMLRILVFLLLSVVYIAFWLNLGILFSVLFKQPATSALASIAVWIFFSIFYSMIVSFIQKATMPNPEFGQIEVVTQHQLFVQNISRISPNYLFNESTATLLTPTVRTLGPLTMEQQAGAIPSPLPFGQNLLLIWPQLTGLIAATMVCFAISYMFFMKQEIRSK